MPLSSSSVYRRIPEAPSTSRERNLTVDPRAIGEASDGRRMVAELRDASVTGLANVKSTLRVDPRDENRNIDIGMRTGHCITTRRASASGRWYAPTRRRLEVGIGRQMLGPNPLPATKNSSARSSTARHSTAHSRFFLQWIHSLMNSWVNWSFSFRSAPRCQRLW
jgi:hypothetical protein